MICKEVFKTNFGSSNEKFLITVLRVSTSSCAVTDADARMKAIDLHMRLTFDLEIVGK